MMISIPNVHTLVRQATVRINWLQLIIQTIDLLSEISAFLRGLGMPNEYVPLFALLLLVGGVMFWLFLVGAVLLGGFRLVMSGVWAVVDLLPTRHASGGEIVPREPKDDEVGPFILDPQHD